jgi:hypothetical protein
LLYLELCAGSSRNGAIERTRSNGDGDKNE